LAIYVPDSTRRRRLVVIAVACLVAGLVVGALAGRATAPGVDDAVARAKDHAEAAVTALQRLPIEYEQALAGEGEDTATITSAVDSARDDFDAAYEEIDLLGPSAREGVDGYLDQLGQAVADTAPLEEFQAVLGDAVAAIQELFGLATDVPQD
jgi:hypothetical protein